MTDRNGRTMWIGVLLAAAALMAVSGRAALADEPASAATGPTTSTDWPPWRGPARDGVAGPGPKLADAWPDGGPKLLWKSGPIACGLAADEGWGHEAHGGEEGGLGSVTVAGDRAFVYVHWKRKGAAVVITTKDLENFGWMEGVPDDLGMKVDEEAKKHNGFHRKPDEKLDVFLKDFQASLDPKLVEKFGPWIEKRITLLWKGHPTEVKYWGELSKISDLRDKEFATYKELSQAITKRGGFNFYGSQELADHLNTMGNAYTDTVVCLDVSTGKEIWKKEFPGAPSTEMLYFGASGTPAVWDGKCYASGSAGLYCLSVNDGSVVWQAKTAFTHPSPLVANGGVFLMLGEGLIGFDAKTGQLLWKQPKIRNRASSVVSWAGGNKSYLMATDRGGASCVDPSDGKVVWHCPYNGGDGNGTPVICGDIMVDPNSNMRAIRLADEKGEQLWAKPPGSANDGQTALVYQGYIYQASPRYSGWVRCRNLKTGEFKWLANWGCQCTSTIAADGKIFFVHTFGSRKPRLMMFNANPEKFELLGVGSATDAVPEGCTPSIANGKLYVRLADCLACYDITAAGNPVVTPPKLPVFEVKYPK